MTGTYRWEPWQGGAAAWDALLAQFPDGTVYQSHAWGEHKCRGGWAAHRLVATGNGQPVAMAQVLVRRFPLGVAVAWVTGGPLGLVEAWGESFRRAIASVAAASHLYCRINPTREHADADCRILEAAGWRRPRHPMLSGQSILLDLGPSDTDWLASIDAKHRYYVRKSSAAGLVWAHGNTPELRRDLVLLTHRLSEEKAMDLQERDLESLEALSDSMPGRMQLLVGHLASEPVTGCMVLVQGGKAHYVTAATVGAGRQVSAAYCMFSKLRSLLHEQKIVALDFGGVDPASESARGVDHFKRGFGGQQVRYLGEWDWASSALLRRAADRLINLRARPI